ncbi:MAG: hypothetical protein U9Q74_08755, partial [Gemmatimonadota bacterium]|nr:hypothetical protein [Gemmatimonadota bacterium]
MPHVRPDRSAYTLTGLVPDPMSPAVVIWYDVNDALVPHSIHPTVCTPFGFTVPLARKPVLATFVAAVVVTVGVTTAQVIAYATVAVCPAVTVTACAKPPPIVQFVLLPIPVPVKRTSWLPADTFVKVTDPFFAIARIVGLADAASSVTVKGPAGWFVPVTVLLTAMVPV